MAGGLIADEQRMGVTRKILEWAEIGAIDA
jgi:hypothetical protein